MPAASGNRGHSWPENCISTFTGQFWCVFSVPAVSSEIVNPILLPFQHLELRSFPAGEVVMTQGEPHCRLLVLKEGAVEVLKDDVRVARSREPGAVFGELSLLLDSSHTATVRTTKPSSFYVVDNPKEFLREHPEATLELCRLLARRIDALNRYLVDVKHQFEGQEGHIGLIGDVLDTLMHHQPKTPPLGGPAPSM